MKNLFGEEIEEDFWEPEQIGSIGLFLSPNLAEFGKPGRLTIVMKNYRCSDEQLNVVMRHISYSIPIFKTIDSLTMKLFDNPKSIGTIVRIQYDGSSCNVCSSAKTLSFFHIGISPIAKYCKNHGSWILACDWEDDRDRIANLLHGLDNVDLFHLSPCGEEKNFALRRLGDYAWRFFKV